VIHLASALFFTLALLAALTTLHVVVQLSWREIVAALRGELGLGVSPRTQRALASPRRRAAF
jgi:hypothetical protein